ncbi:hypothetical protein KC347_g144 [Hortaea werneckii]|nr:hypothetical protein KC347_g144 [Hortaea werneckii]
MIDSIHSAFCNPCFGWRLAAYNYYHPCCAVVPRRRLMQDQGKPSPFATCLNIPSERRESCGLKGAADPSSRTNSRGYPYTLADPSCTSSGRKWSSLTGGMLGSRWTMTCFSLRSDSTQIHSSRIIDASVECSLLRPKRQRGTTGIDARLGNGSAQFRLMRSPQPWQL